MPSDIPLTPGSPRRHRSVKERDTPWRTAFLLSGFLPLLGLLWSPPQPTALFYSAYVAICYFRWVPLRGCAGFVFAALLTGAMIETLHWLGDYLHCANHNHTFHPQLLANLILAFGQYAGAALAWVLLFRRFGFSTAEAFVIHGIMGISVAHQGEILLMGLRTLPVGVLAWIWVYGVYGCMVGIARRLSAPSRRQVPRELWHYPVALATCTAGTLGGLYGWAWLVARLGTLPMAQPICQAPFW